MANVVSSIPGSGVRRRYDWDSWFDGQTWCLTEGTDYDSFTSLKGCCASAARSRGVVVSIKKRGNVAYIQAVKGGET